MYFNDENEISQEVDLWFSSDCLGKCQRLSERALLYMLPKALLYMLHSKRALKWLQRSNLTVLLIQWVEELLESLSAQK